jgi:hypothetical protein
MIRLLGFVCVLIGVGGAAFAADLASAGATPRAGALRGFFIFCLACHRRFPPPWSVDELDACFFVIDGAGQKLAYVNYEEERASIGGQAAHQGRGSADCGQYRQAAGIAAALVKRRNRLKSAAN